MSIQPKWCELIANGKKTVEVRKTKPKLETPFKCYIYCTKESYKGKYLHTSNQHGKLLFWHNPNDTTITVQPEEYDYTAYTCGGKVVGEFVCDEIEEYECEFYGDDEQPVFEAIYGYIFNDDAEDTFCYIETSNDRDYPDDCSLCENSCLSFQEIRQYMNFKSGKFYGWHISNLLIYDKPKELSECTVDGDCPCENCRKCKWFDSGNGYNVEDDCLLPYTNSFSKAIKPLFRPPQSWCYVEEWIP